jgi:hypothetical protein
MLMTFVCSRDLLARLLDPLLSYNLRPDQIPAMSAVPPIGSLKEENQRRARASQARQLCFAGRYLLLRAGAVNGISF